LWVSQRMNSCYHCVFIEFSCSFKGPKTKLLILKKNNLQVLLEIKTWSSSSSKSPAKCHLIYFPLFVRVVCSYNGGPLPQFLEWSRNLKIYSLPLSLAAGFSNPRGALGWSEQTRGPSSSSSTSSWPTSSSSRGGCGDMLLGVFSSSLRESILVSESLLDLAGEVWDDGISIIVREWGCGVGGSEEIISWSCGTASSIGDIPKSSSSDESSGFWMDCIKSPARSRARISLVLLGVPGFETTVVSSILVPAVEPLEDCPPVRPSLSSVSGSVSESGLRRTPQLKLSLLSPSTDSSWN